MSIAGIVTALMLPVITLLIAAFAHVMRIAYPADAAVDPRHDTGDRVTEAPAAPQEAGTTLDYATPVQPSSAALAGTWSLWVLAAYPWLVALIQAVAMLAVWQSTGSPRLRFGARFASPADELAESAGCAFMFCAPIQLAFYLYNSHTAMVGGQSRRALMAALLFLAGSIACLLLDEAGGIMAWLID